MIGNGFGYMEKLSFSYNSVTMVGGVERTNVDSSWGRESETNAFNMMKL